MLKLLKRIDRYEQLIVHGDFEGAIHRIERYENELRRMEADIYPLINAVNNVDRSMTHIVRHLKNEDRNTALSVIQMVRREVPKIASAAIDFVKKF
jgi:uncharacterized protein (UPF0335 family)